MFSNAQFGFRQGKSTVGALIKIVDGALTSFESGNCHGLSIIDLSKAFHCVSHMSLRIKLHHYGFDGISIGIIGGYLKNRTSFVSNNFGNSGNCI